MKRALKKYIVSHEGNGHKPHLLREEGVLAFLLVILVVFGLAHVQAYLVRTYAPAAVVSSVVVDLVNGDRTTRGVHPLVVSPVLTKAAELKAEDMAKRGYFSHVSPDNITPWHWLSVAGYDFMYAGENLAVNFSESRDVENAWMQSAGHRNNILSGTFTEIGVATAEGMLDGRPTVFVVQMFGQPMPSTSNTKQLTQKKIDYLASSRTKPEVASVSTSSVPEKSQVRVTEVKDMYIAFEDTSVRSQPKSQNLEPTPRYSGSIARLMFGPKRILATTYGLLALVVFATFGSILVGEVKRHHAKMFVYGFALILVMVAFAYAFSVSISSVILIA